jgi:hypothetical protein
VLVVSGLALRLPGRTDACLLGGGMTFYEWTFEHPFAFFWASVVVVVLATIVGETISSFARRPK